MILSLEAISNLPYNEVIFCGRTNFEVHVVTMLYQKSCCNRASYNKSLVYRDCEFLFLKCAGSFNESSVA